MTIQELEAKQTELVARLDNGATKIEEAKAQGKPVAAWETVWLDLLLEYTAICEKLREKEQTK